MLCSSAIVPIFKVVEIFEREVAANFLCSASVAANKHHLFTKMTIPKILGFASKRLLRAIGFASKKRLLGNKHLSSKTGVMCKEDNPQSGLPSDIEAIKTGFESGVDWVAGTIHCHFKDLDAITKFVDFVGGQISDEFLIQDHGKLCGHTWHPLYWLSAAYGSIITACVDDRLDTHLYISITGKACRTNQQCIAQLLVYLSGCGFSATRLDCAVADFDCRLKYEQIKRAIDSGECKGFRPQKSKRIAGYQDKNWTHYCGVKDSGSSFTRIYHDEERCCVRVERQYTDRDAKLVFAHLAKIYDERNHSISFEESGYFREIANLSISTIGFIKRISKHLDRCPDLAWWERFKKAINSNPIKFPPEIRTISIEKTMNWFERQIKSSIAFLKKAMGSGFNDWWLGLCKRGNDALTPKQLAILKSQAGYKVSSNAKKFTGNAKQVLADIAQNVLNLQEQFDKEYPIGAEW